jgi:hypothetical protein
MKAIINGKTYNTETATEIGHYSRFGYTDFRYIDEGLFRTKKGNYFLAGEGGAMTHYSHRCSDNSSCGGKKIIPLDESEAREWMEEHCEIEEYIAAFGEPEEA